MTFSATIFAVRWAPYGVPAVLLGDPYRFNAENLLSERALERKWWGWGRFDPSTGRAAWKVGGARCRCWTRRRESAGRCDTAGAAARSRNVGEWITAATCIAA